MEDSVLIFRNNMAEQGHEYTPAQAQVRLQIVRQFQEHIIRQAQNDPSQLERLASLSLQEKQITCRKFAENGKEITVDQLEEIIQLVLHVYQTHYSQGED